MLSVLIQNLYRFRRAVLEYIQSDEITVQITELKRGELFAGKRGDDNDITPKYQDVPGFEFWYLDWKRDNVPTYRLDGTPDLYIDGTFHRSLYTEYISPGVYRTDSNYEKDYMYQVIEMHTRDSDTLLDLTTENRELIANEIETFILNLNV